MQPQVAQTAQDVINQVLNLSGTIAIVSVPTTISIVQGIKGLGLNTRFIGIISAIIGFVIALLFARIFDGTWFNTINVAVALVVAAGAPGIFSIAKATATPQSPVTTPQNTIVS